MINPPPSLHFFVPIFPENIVLNRRFEESYFLINRLMSERSKHQLTLLGSEVNRESLKLFETPVGLTDNDFRMMTDEVDSKMTKIKADVRQIG